MKLMLVLALGATLPTYGMAATEIKAGGYVFPPYVDKGFSLTKEFIVKLNQYQKDFIFKFVETSSRRRYDDLKDKKIDLLLFEDPVWGWENTGAEASKTFYTDGEVYVTLADPKKNQSYFDNLKNTKLLIVRGYHYGFAHFNANENTLKKEFKIDFANSPDLVIKKLLEKRGDVCVITISYLKRYLAKNPSDKQRLLISERKDQDYALSAIIGKESPVKKIAFDALLDKMKADGTLDKFFALNKLGE